MDNNHMCTEAWDEINYQLSKFNGCTVDVWEWESDYTPLFIMDILYNYSSMLGLKPINVSKMGPMGVNVKANIYSRFPITNSWRKRV